MGVADQPQKGGANESILASGSTDCRYYCTSMADAALEGWGATFSPAQSIKALMISSRTWNVLRPRTRTSEEGAMRNGMLAMPLFVASGSAAGQWPWQTPI